MRRRTVPGRRQGISGQAVATGERIARAAATMMRWQLTCMAITVAGTRRTAQPDIRRLPQPGEQETIADPPDEEHKRILEWLGLEVPSDFDPAQVRRSKSISPNGSVLRLDRRWQRPDRVK